MERRRRAEVKMSTLLPGQGTQHVCQMFCGRGGITSKDLTVSVNENKMRWVVTFKDCGFFFDGERAFSTQENHT